MIKGKSVLMMGEAFITGILTGESGLEVHVFGFGSVSLKSSRRLYSRQ